MILGDGGSRECELILLLNCLFFFYFCICFDSIKFEVYWIIFRILFVNEIIGFLLAWILGHLDIGFAADYIVFTETLKLRNVFYIPDRVLKINSILFKF